MRLGSAGFGRRLRCGDIRTAAAACRLPESRLFYDRGHYAYQFKLINSMAPTEGFSLLLLQLLLRVSLFLTDDCVTLLLADVCLFSAFWPFDFIPI